MLLSVCVCVLLTCVFALQADGVCVLPARARPFYNGKRGPSRQVSCFCKSDSPLYPDWFLFRFPRRCDFSFLFFFSFPLDDRHVSRINAVSVLWWRAVCRHGIIDVSEWGKSCMDINKWSDERHVGIKRYYGLFSMACWFCIYFFAHAALIMIDIVFDVIDG